MVNTFGDENIAMVESIGYKVLETDGDCNYFSPTPRGKEKLFYRVNEWITDTTGHGLYLFQSHKDARAWIGRQNRTPGGQGAMLGKLWAIWECRCEGDIRPGDNPDNPEELMVKRLMPIRIVEKDPRLTELEEMKQMIHGP
jgi:hypothetical protein